MKILFIILMIYSHETCNLVGNMVTMKEIPLTKGKVALVDDEDYDRLMAMGKWHYNKGYANMNLYYKDTNGIGRYKKISMHRIVMRLNDSSIHGDHIDGDKLNNQKYNLRECTNAENSKNRGKRKDNSSGYKGVVIVGKKWRAVIELNRKPIHIGMYETAEDAAKAYNLAAVKYHGEFAKLNEIPA